MKYTTSILMFSPIAVSIISSLLMVLNNSFSVLPAWVLWETSIISTALAILLNVSLIVAWLVQWVTQQFSRKQSSEMIQRR